MPKRQTDESHIVTANRLADGVVVFLRHDGRWVETVQEATAAHDPETLRRLMNIAEAHMRDAVVVGAYPVAIEESDSGWSPVALRERIRAHGLTFRAISADAVAWL